MTIETQSDRPTHRAAWGSVRRRSPWRSIARSSASPIFGARCAVRLVGADVGGPLGAGEVAACRGTRGCLPRMGIDIPRHGLVDDAVAGEPLPRVDELWREEVVADSKGAADGLQGGHIEQ